MQLPEIALFLSDLRKQCKQHGIKLILARSKDVWLNDDMKCIGYFSHEEKELAVAKYSDQFLGALVHESCHLDQFVEQCEVWKKEEKCGTTIFDKWHLGKKVASIRKALNNTIALELDCEKRALKKIAQYDLPINSTSYIQRANSILLYYRYSFEVGVWSNKNIDNFAKFPSRFMSDAYYKKKLSNKIRKIFTDEGL